MEQKDEAINASRLAVSHLLGRIAGDRQVQYLLGAGMESFELLTDAAAKLYWEPVNEVRNRFIPGSAVIHRVNADIFRLQSDPRKPHIKTPASIPFEIVAEHATQAWKNHGQTLERLNQRGGLGVVELWHVVNDQDWYGPLDCGARVTAEQAAEWLESLLADRAIRTGGAT